MESGRSIRIGNLNIAGAAFLAPMAGVTDYVYRHICRRFGAAAVYSEMISAKGLHYRDKKTADLMNSDDEERPFAIQIFGSEPKIMAEAAELTVKMAEPDLIDINMGCPAPKIVNNGDGSALMKNPKLMGEIMYAVSEAVNVPVTAKIRSGYDTENAAEAAKILEENGAAAVAVHGRTRKQFYSGRADWDIIRSVKQELKIPVIGNGDIMTAYDAKRMLDYTGCDAVMVARGAEGNPFIFRQINELLTEGGVKTEVTPLMRINMAAEHLDALTADKGERRGVCEARKHMAWYIKGLPNASALKTEIFGMNTAKDIKNRLYEYAKTLRTDE